MPKTLVIVESPTKAKTISKFLGSGFVVESSFGHVRDLPKSKMGVDIEHGSFAPTYIVPRDRNAQIKKLKEKAKKCDEILFATDEDREGEAISWHLAHILDIKPEDAKRMVFHEITKTAIEEALKHHRPIDANLVDAQQARRILDRLVGYELSPFLWKKVARGLSAGRVQSVAVRLVVEREREIQNFKSDEYWTIDGIFKENKTAEQTFLAKLYSIAGKKLDKLDIKNKEQADRIVNDLNGIDYKISSIEKKEATRTPPPPFVTSTFQQAVNQKLGYSAKQAMRLAQQLYEGIELGPDGHVGLITYMRTDSLNLSEKFLNEAREFAVKKYGREYGLPKPRFYKTKSKGAQEAHEAIRPTDVTRTPDSVKPYLSPQLHKVYTLVWRRALATQMAAAKLNRTAIDVQGKNYLFRANGQTMIFPGWMKLYTESIREELLPELKEKQIVVCDKINPEQHFTEPPARYTDATLIKIMEEYGIGRPSTYAPTIATIEDRHYVERDEQKRLKPTDIALIVNDLLVEHFANIVDFQFTAQMEQNLDEIATGEKKWQPIISEFYYPFHENLAKKTEEISKKEITEEATDEKCPKCGGAMVIKIGRFGKFLACSNYPECKTTKQINSDGTIVEPEATNEVCEKCGKPMAVKHGRFGAFLGCSDYPDCKYIKKVEKKTGVTCNLCGQGEFVERRGKRGPFYSCNRYPECKNILSTKPTGEVCPTCKAPIIFAAKGATKCSNKKCDYKTEAKEKDDVAE